MDINNYEPYREMYRVNSLNDLLIKAMKAERHDRVKYERMMESTKNEAVKQQIKFAYDDEIKHYKMFNQMYFQLTGKKIDIPIPTNIEKYNSLMEAVKSSIEGESEAVDLYREIYALMSNKQMRDKVFEIITDEQEHFGRFIYLYSMLK
jgi:rubrerythrin